ncbi:hypothetical protein [Phaeobacter inhibens]|uniref:hypothetical protein n=1 Tax=Phaeobacter inhibens TaxID=221822 RepID=UPI0021A6DF58|nr:hypothetical protein [Phaeobacter inhibens]UWR99270.1 hypothetical protein K4L03_12760 [Phaeobacter inhibens]
MPFDLAGERAVLFDIGDLVSVDDAKKRISNATKLAFKTSSYKSSVLRILEHSDLFGRELQEPVSRSLVDTMEDLAGSVQEMQADLVSLEMAIDGIEFHSTAEIDPHLENKLDEILTLFSRVGPSEISRLADLLKHPPKN